jgi:hypothetical protein
MKTIGKREGRTHRGIYYTVYSVEVFLDNKSEGLF